MAYFVLLPSEWYIVTCVNFLADGPKKWVPTLWQRTFNCTEKLTVSPSCWSSLTKVYLFWLGRVVRLFCCHIFLISNCWIKHSVFFTSGWEPTPGSSTSKKLRQRINPWTRKVLLVLCVFLRMCVCCAAWRGEQLCHQPVSSSCRISTTA